MTDLAFGPAIRRPRGLLDMLKPIVGDILMATGTAFVNGGTAILNARVLQSGAAPKNIGWGTGTTTPSVTDTALQAEVAPTSTVARTVGTESNTTTTVTNDTYAVTGTITATLSGPTAITEVGTFTSATAGAASLFIHGVFAALNLIVGNSIAFTVNLVSIASEA